MAAKITRLMCVLVAGITVGACGNGDGQASQAVKECVARKQDVDRFLGGPATPVADLLADCEAEAKLGPTNEGPGCHSDRMVLEVAIESYLANGGALPATQAGLVQNNLLREALPDFDIGPNSEVVPTPDGPCA